MVGMSWADLFERYVLAPHAAWPQDRPLQADKLVQFTARRAEALGLPDARAIEGILQSVSDRRKTGHPTLFLVNCGSSGSHWIEAMLSALPGVHACGEVYVPPGFGEQLQALPQTDRASFLDALHQIHAESPATPVGEADILINSAHSWGPFDLMAGRLAPVLLLRDPLDVVMSRTFRKPKLRRHLRPEASDLQYLEQNVAMVSKFYLSALRRNPPCVVRYEDALADPGRALARLTDLLGLAASPESLEEIGARFSARSQQTSSHRLSNVYTGPRHEVPAAILEQASAALAPVRRKLGYA